MLQARSKSINEDLYNAIRFRGGPDSLQSSLGITLCPSSESAFSSTVSTPIIHVNIIVRLLLVFKTDALQLSPQNLCIITP